MGKIINHFEVKIQIRNGKRTKLEVTGHTTRSDDKAMIINGKEENVCKLTDDIVRHVKVYMELKENGTI